MMMILASSVTIPLPVGKASEAIRLVAIVVAFITLVAVPTVRFFRKERRKARTWFNISISLICIASFYSNIQRYSEDVTLASIVFDVGLLGILTSYVIDTFSAKKEDNGKR